MKKDKKQMKKEMKDKMKTKLRVKVKKKMKKFKILFIIASTIAAIVAAAKAIDLLLEKKNAKKAEGSSLKQVFALMASKTVSYAEKISGGVMLGGYFSSLKADFSKCEFENGAFIAVKSACSYVSIVVPENVNIKFDCLNLCAFVKQEYDTESFDESLPTVYIALKGALSSVFISRGVTCEETNEEVKAEA